MRKLITLATLATLVLLNIAPAAAEAEQSTLRTSPTETPSLDKLDQHKAAQWGLKVEEWKRYQSLMQGPMGVQSPNLDPLTALGIEARDAHELARYAELQVQMETARVTKLLAFQNAYDQAYKRLYPDMLPVNLVSTASKPQSSPAEAGDRLALFASADCSTCSAVIKTLQRDKASVDIYLVGSRSNDDVLRAWALKSGVEAARVRNRQITLNHDAGRWARLGLQGEFPAVVRQVDGQWVRQ